MFTQQAGKTEDRFSFISLMNKETNFKLGVHNLYMHLRIRLFLFGVYLTKIT